MALLSKWLGRLKEKLVLVRHAYIMSDSGKTFGIIGGKKNQEKFWNNRMTFGNNCLNITHFLAASQLNL